MFRKYGHLNVEGHFDADWAESSDRKSTSGYFTFVGGNLITWRSKKHKVVALSSAEAEFRGISKGVCELLWLRSLLTEIGYLRVLQQTYIVTTEQPYKLLKIQFNITGPNMWRLIDTLSKKNLKPR